MKLAILLVTLAGLVMIPANADELPVLAPIGAQSVNEGNTLNFTVSATDADLDNLTFDTNATDLPFASFNDNSDGTASLEFNPGFSDAGTYQIDVNVTDGMDYDQETFTLTVDNVLQGIITVCEVGCDFTAIQPAIDASITNGEVRILDSREYHEALDVDVTGLLLTSDASSNPLVWSDTDHTVEILNDDVIISNIQIKYNGTNAGIHTIFGDSLNNVHIENNTIDNIGIGGAGHGIKLDFTSNSVISNNIINTGGGSSNMGINLGVSNSNVISHNKVTTSGSNAGSNIGIILSSGTDNIISHNIVSTTTGGRAVETITADRTLISDNIISTSGPSSHNLGITISAGSDNIIENNFITTNGTTHNYGMRPGGTNDLFINNTIIAGGTGGNNIGICGGGSDEFRNMNITTGSSSNTNYGLLFAASDNARYYDSIINAPTSNDVFLTGTPPANNQNFFVNVTFDKNGVGVDSPTQITKLFVQHRLDVEVLDDSLNPIDSASVNGNDTPLIDDMENPTASFAELTNSSGFIPQQIITEFMANGTFFGTNQLFFNNYTIEASKIGFANEIANVNITDDVQIQLILDTAPEPTPDFKIQRGNFIMNSAQTTFSLTEGVDFEQCTGDCFIQITGTRNSGMGQTLGGGQGNFNAWSTYISDNSGLQTPGGIIAFTRHATASDDNRITWQITEYIGEANGPNEMQVLDSGVCTFTTTGLVCSTNVAGGESDPNDVAVLITGVASPDAGRADMQSMLVTTHWNSATYDAVFTRGEAASDATDVSYAVVEYTGTNWALERVEHIGNATALTTETLTNAPDVSKAFVLQAQQRNDAGANFDGLCQSGEEVWISGPNQLSFNHPWQSTNWGPAMNEVVWVLSNSETDSSKAMHVQHLQPIDQRDAIGIEEENWQVDINPITYTQEETALAGLTTHVDGCGTFYPRTNTMGILFESSSTQVDFYQSDSDQEQDYAFSVVEYPRSVKYEIPTQGLVAEWKFEDDALDTSSNSNHGTVTGATYVNGIIGRSLNFDGVDDIVRVPNHASLNFDIGSFSLSYWIQTSDDKGNVVMHKRDNNGVYEGYVVDLSNDLVRTSVRDQQSDVVKFVAPTNVSDNSPHHITYVFDKNTFTASIFIDNQLVASQPIPANLENIDQNTIGLDVGGRGPPNTGNTFFNGIIDQIRLYDRVLTVPEIEALYNE